MATPYDDYGYEDWWNATGEDAPSYEDTYGSSTLDWLTNAGSDVLSGIKDLFTNKETGSVDWQNLLTLGGGIAGALGLGSGEPAKVGYQGKIPEYSALRKQIPQTYDPARRPGSGGQRYFTDILYSEKAPEQVAAAQESLGTQAAELQAANLANKARRMQVPTQGMAAGGIAGLKKGTYLRGATDGMADEVPAKIGKDQPAALSHGEFVIPADVVSHLGNGNSDAGAKKLYEMMDRIRKARTGNKQQGKQINPNKYLPR
jgi:hypothetical protein